MSIKLKKIQQSTTAFEFAEGLYGKAGMHSFFMEESMGLTTSQFCNKNGLGLRLVYPFRRTSASLSPPGPSPPYDHFYCKIVKL